ncbi:MAG: hypothetical protein RL701_4498 [Pseudomonadota bacterium]|jgi:hypothetical protein
MDGLVQVDAVVYNQSSVDQLDPGSGVSLNENRFVLRRARLQADVERGYFRGYISLEANSQSDPPLRVQRAEVAVRYPADSAPSPLLAAAGLFIIPFGFGTLESDNERLFLEPPHWVNAFFPGRRDLGARVEGRYRFLHANLAVMNGEPSNAAFPIRDPNIAKDFVARVTASGAITSAVQVTGGASLLLGSGFHRGKQQTKDSLIWRDVNEDGAVQITEVQVIAGASAEPSRNFARYGLGGDLVVRARLPVIGDLLVFGEVAWGKNLDRGLWPADPVAAGRSFRELGYALGISQQLTRHAELGVRYDGYNPDLDASDRQGRTLVPIDASFRTLALTAAWRSFDIGRIAVEYAHHQNALGRNQNGTPTTLAADSLTIRAQLVF